MLKALWHKHRKRQRVKPPRKSQTENPSPATLYEAVCLYLKSAISRPGALEDKKCLSPLSRWPSRQMSLKITSPSLVRFVVHVFMTGVCEALLHVWDASCWAFLREHKNRLYVLLPLGGF